MGRYLNRSDQGERIRQVLQIDPSRTSQDFPRTAKRVIRRLDDTRVAQLAQGYLDGLPVDDLAVQFNVDPATVQKHVRKLDLPRRSPRLGPAHLDEAAELYRSGQSLVTLGKRYGVGKDAVARALRKAGVELRKRNGWTKANKTEPRRNGPVTSRTPSCASRTR